jgi:cyclopropane-fatty-acyl-phospholipid synthase
MRKDPIKNIVQDILWTAGIAINGHQPWDIQVHTEAFYRRVLHDGSLGLGESYMDGWWDCENLDEFFYRLIPLRPEDKIRKSRKLLFHALIERLRNKSCTSRAFQIGERHYDSGNELFRNMLDQRMVYSCAYWKEADNLYDAQEAKLELICRKLGIRSGDRILDIGCGWGSFAKYAAEKYGVHVIGITVSKEQANYGQELCKCLPVEIRLQDYRDINDTFDHIVSIGMFEHVGWKNYRTFMKVAHRLLKDGGLFLLHTIGSKQSNITSDAWMEKYIFPNSIIPSMKQISAAIENLFVAEDWHNFGADYDKTLISWFRNFDSSWEGLKERYDERFYRMWKFYLLSSAGAFRARDLQVWQIVLSKCGVSGGYSFIR